MTTFTRGYLLLFFCFRALLTFFRSCLKNRFRASLGTHMTMVSQYSKTCVKRPLSKRPKIGFQDQLSLNAGQKYYRMLQGEHSAILLTFIKLPFVINIFVLSIFEWLFYTGFTVLLVYIQRSY